MPPPVEPEPEAVVPVFAKPVDVASPGAMAALFRASSYGSAPPSEPVPDVQDSAETLAAFAGYADMFMRAAGVALGWEIEPVLPTLEVEKRVAEAWPSRVTPSAAGETQRAVARLQVLLDRVRTRRRGPFGQPPPLA